MVTIGFFVLVLLSSFIFTPQSIWAETITWPWKATIDGHTLEDVTIIVEANTKVCVLPPSYFEGALRYFVGGYDNGSIWWTGTTVAGDYPKCKKFPAGGALTIGSDTLFTANMPYGPGIITYTPGTLAPARQWQTETVDAQYSMGAYNSIAVDSAGHPHISYYDGAYYNLKYAYHNGSGWEIVTVDGQTGIDLGNFTSIALDSNDRPHIAYRSNEGVKYAYLDGQDIWQAETVVETVVGSPTIIYMEISLALDYADRPHICFVAGENLYYANPVMKYISKDSGGNWTPTEDVDTATNYFASLSIAVDPNNTPHIGYVRDSRAWYAKRIGPFSWTSAQVGTDSTAYPAYQTAIAVDALGTPHLSFEYVHAWWGGLKYAYLDGSSSWQVIPVDTLDGTQYDPTYSDSLYDTSITIDSDGHPHIVYNGFSSVLKYAYYNGSQWTFESIDSSSVFRLHVDIASGPNNDPHISYYDVTSGDLKYAIQSSSALSDPDLEDDGINDSIDGQVVPNTTNFIDESDIYSSHFTDIHLGGTTYGQITDRNNLDVLIDDLSIFGVVINVTGDPLTYATINVCGIPYAFYGGDSGTMTCGSSTALILTGQPEARLMQNVIVLLPNGTMSTINELSDGAYSILNHEQSLAPVTIVDNGVESDVSAGESDIVSPQVAADARELLEELIDFYNAAIADGTLEGTGRSRMWQKLHVLLQRMNLKLALWQYDLGHIDRTCHRLNRAYLRADGDNEEIKDFIQGAALEELQERILEIMDVIGCNT